MNRCINFPAKNLVEVLDEPLDASPLKPDEVLIRSDVSLVSAGTELSRLHGTEGSWDGNPDYPWRPGYATIGRVQEIGPRVTDVRVGDRVFFAGKHQAIQRFTTGQGHQWGRCYPVPEHLASEDAVMVCLAQIALVAPWVAEAGPADTVAVFGLGVIGNLCAQLYQIHGARVIGLDPVAERCELARRCGIREVLSVPPEHQVNAVRTLTGGADGGAEVTVDAVGHSAVVRTCVEATRALGSAVLLGTPRTPLAGDLTPMLNRTHLQGIAIRGAHMYRFPAMRLRGVSRSVEDAYRMLFGLMQDGRLQVGPLRSHLADPADAPRLYHELHANRDTTWGVVFDWRSAAKAAG